MTTSLLLLLL